jgi:hypothetical protein
VNLLNAIARSTRRDDKEQEREEKRAERKAEKEKEREEKEREKEKEKALALAEAEAKASAPPPPAGNRRGENGNRRPRLGARLAASQEGNGAAAPDRSRAEIPSAPPPLQGADPRVPTQRDGSRSSFSIGRRGK